MAPAMASKVGIPIVLTDICSLLFSNRQLRRRRRLADLEDSSPSAASLKPKPPLPNVNLWYGPRVVPWADPEGRKPVWYYPHARGYHNCFLGELCDAVWLPNIALPCIFVFDRSVIERALRRTLYGTTAIFGILASLSLAGVEYRRLELIKREHCYTQEETVCRKESTADVLTASGALWGLVAGRFWANKANKHKRLLETGNSPEQELIRFQNFC